MKIENVNEPSDHDVRLPMVFGVKPIRIESCVVIPPLTKREIWRMRWESFKYNAIQVVLLILAAFSFAVAIHGWPF